MDMKCKELIFLMVLFFRISYADTIPKFKINYELWINDYAHSISFGFIKKNFHYDIGTIWFPSLNPIKEMGRWGLKNSIQFFPEQNTQRFNLFFSINWLSLYNYEVNRYLYTIEKYTWNNAVLPGMGIQLQITFRLFMNFQVNTNVVNLEYLKWINHNPAIPVIQRNVSQWDLYLNYPYYNDNFFSVMSLNYRF